MAIDKDILKALETDGQERLDDIVPDPISTEEAHRMMNHAIQNAMKQRNKKRRKATLFRRYAAIAVVAFALLIVLTPLGRAMAEEAARSIVRFFNTHIFVQDSVKAEDIVKTQKIPEGQYDYSSIYEAAQALEHPLVGLDEGVVSSKTTLIVQPAADSIITIYENENNGTLMVIEQIYANEGDVGTTIQKSEDSTPVVKKIFNGTDIYLSYNTDGTGGYAIWDNIVLMVSSSTMTIEELSGFIDQLHNIE